MPAFFFSDNIAGNVIVVVIVLLTITSLILAWNKSNALTPALGGVVILCFILSGAQYKHFEGFGFKADAWSQEQIEAAVLIRRLTALSETTSRQMGLLASRLGLWGSGLTNPEMQDLITDTERSLEAADIPEEKREIVIRPIVERIKLNYVAVAIGCVNQIYGDAIGKIEFQINKLPPTAEARLALLEEQKKIQANSGEVQAIDDNLLIKSGSLTPLIKIVESSVAFDQKDELLSKLSVLDTDLHYYASNKDLRRRVDINDYCNPQNK